MKHASKILAFGDFKNRRTPVRFSSTDNKPEDFKKNHIHENGIKTLTSYNIYINPEVKTSNLINYLNTSGINILKGEENCIELIFDNGINKKEIDFRPRLPLIIKY